MPPESALSDLAGDPFRLGDLLDYQESAVVSRTLVDTEAVTLTVFAFDETERLSEHTAPHDVLLQVLDGAASVTVDGTAADVAAGESIVLPADVPHAVDAETRFKMLLTLVR